MRSASTPSSVRWERDSVYSSDHSVRALRMGGVLFALSALPLLAVPILIRKLRESRAFTPPPSRHR